MTSDRRDLVCSAGPSLIYEPSERWSVSIFAEYRRNESTQDKFSFVDVQAGICVKAKF